MYRILIATLIVAFSLPLCSIGQEIDERLNFISENMKSVQGKKKKYDQQFTKSSDHPMVFSVTITDVDDGEKIITSANLQDLNPTRINFEPKKDMVHIIAQIRGGKKLVKVEKDGEIGNYDNEVVFYAPGIEEARSLTDALTKAAELAEKEIENSDESEMSKEELLGYFKTAIGEVVINDESFKQSFSFDENNSNVFEVTIENVSKGVTEKFQVNAADLYLNKIDFGTQRNQVLVFLSTKGDSKLIAYEKDGEIGSYTNKFEINMQSIEDARTLSSRLKTFVEQSEKEETVDYASYTYDECVEFLSRNINKVVINQDAYEQNFSINPDNNLLFSLAFQDVSKGDNYTYTMNAADLKKGKTNFDTKGNAVFIDISTENNRKLINTSRGEEAANYDNAFQLRSQNIEDARALSEVFTRFISLASEEMQKKIGMSDAGEAESYITKSVDKLVINTDSYDQSIEINSENSCIYTYEFTDVSKDTQYDYEFNFRDLDVNKITFDTKGVQAIVNLEATGKKKLIKTFKNGEMDKYEYQFVILAEDIEEARNLVAALKLKAKSCNEQ